MRTIAYLAVDEASDIVGVGAEAAVTVADLRCLVTGGDSGLVSAGVEVLVPGRSRGAAQRERPASGAPYELVAVSGMRKVLVQRRFLTPDRMAINQQTGRQGTVFSVGHEGQEEEESSCATECHVRVY